MGVGRGGDCRGLSDSPERAEDGADALLYGTLVQLRSDRRPRAGLGGLGKRRRAAGGHIGSGLFLRVLGDRVVAAERSGVSTGTAFGNQDRVDVESEVFREYKGAGVMNNEDINSFMERMKLERQRQIDKWGADKGTPDYVWLGILMEEIGEAVQSLNRNNAEAMELELVQAATVIMAWVTTR